MEESGRNYRLDELLDVIGNIRNCPWAGWKPATLHFCEALQCERIVAPAETWSNIGYFLIGLFLILRKSGHPEKGLRSVEFRFGLYALVVGVFSTLFHASHTYVFETADLSAMLFLSTELIVTNLIRLGWLRGASPIPFASLLFFGGVGLLLGLEGRPRVDVFGGFIGVAVFFEALIFVRAKRQMRGITPALRSRYRPYIATFILFFIAYAAWILDYTGIVCQPDQHLLSGHAVWHLVNSFCFLTLARFYRGATSVLDPTGAAR